MGLPRSVLIIPLPLAQSNAANVPAISYGLDTSVFSRLEPAPFAIVRIHPETRIRHKKITSVSLPCEGLGLWEIGVPSDRIIWVGILDLILWVEVELVGVVSDLSVPGHPVWERD